jgi:hypothetical protein
MAMTKNRRVMGLIQDLSFVQETYRGLIRDLYPDGISVEVITEDAVVAACCAFHEMQVSHGGDPEVEPSESDVLAAIEFLDHLDTLGKQVTSK